MMMRLGARKPVRRSKIVMLGRMRVAGEGDRRPVAEQSEQVGGIVGVVRRVLRVEIGAQRDVEGEHDEPVHRRQRQQVLHEGELRVGEMAAVGAPDARLLARAGAEIIDIVEHHEERAGMLVRVVGRPEDALPGVARARDVRRLVIKVVVAADVPPRQPDRADDAVEAVVERQIVEHQVADRHAEGGRAAGPDVDQPDDHVVAHVFDLGGRLGLRIGHQDDVEAGRLVDARQLEVDRRRQWPGRRDSLVAEAERGRRAVGIVDIGIAARGLCPDRSAAGNPPA